jgi:hypothetical protein
MPENGDMHRVRRQREPELSYKPDFLPVALSIGESGISVGG